MLRSLLLAAAALLLSSSANACSCLLPPPLSECEVADDQVALLVTFKCIKTLICDINNGVAIADVEIDKIFEDNAGLGLSVGDMVTVSSGTQSALCGIGSSFAPGDQWILFATPASGSPPSAQIDSFVANPGGRRLQQPGGSGPTQLARAVAIADLDEVFSDGTVCDVSSSDLETHLCAGNIFNPTSAQIMELMEGCSNSVPAVFTSKTQR